MLRPGHVRQQVGVELPREAFSGPFSLYMRPRLAVIPGSPPVKPAIVRSVRSRQRSASARTSGIRRVRAGVAVGLHLRRELGPLAFDGRDLVLADLIAPCFELRELFGRVVRLVHPHHLHDLRELLDRWVVGAFQHLEDPLQAPSQAPRVPELGVDEATRGPNLTAAACPLDSLSDGAGNEIREPRRDPRGDVGSRQRCS